MNHTSAEKFANVVLGAAALGIGVYVIKTPPLRRMVWRFAVTALTGTLPAWLQQEVQHAWVESGRRNL